MTHPGQLLKQAKLYAGKELGQNFLSNPGTAESIVGKFGLKPDTPVLEIGPGLGALTIPIAQSCKHVTAVEKDRRLIGLLEQELAAQGQTHVKIVNRDILKTDIQGLATEKKLVVVGNLPYNISSQILFKLIKERSSIEKAYLMFQKELADRIVAPPGKKDYSRLSAVVQYASRVKHLTDIGPASFFPRPEIDSTILEFCFLPMQGFTIEEETTLFSVIKAAFSKRRKTLKNSLAGVELGLDKSHAARVLETAGIDASRRAETLCVEEFKDLTRSLITSQGECSP